MWICALISGMLIMFRVVNDIWISCGIVLYKQMKVFCQANCMRLERPSNTVIKLLMFELVKDFCGVYGP